jgi:mono/diheme cytochrome c family protein
MIGRALAVLALGVGLLGCRAKQKRPVERGAGVYARACATCHGSSNLPGRQRGFSVKPPNLADRALQERLSDEDLKRTIHDGKGEMPAFGRMLSDEELSALVDYLRSLRVARATNE